jgi:hypothetical protein
MKMGCPATGCDGAARSAFQVVHPGGGDSVPQGAGRKYQALGGAWHATGGRAAWQSMAGRDECSPRHAYHRFSRQQTGHEISHEVAVALVLALDYQLFAGNGGVPGSFRCTGAVIAPPPAISLCRHGGTSPVSIA